MDMSKFRDGKVHVRNSGVKGLKICLLYYSTASNSKEPSCPETLKCMLKCKDGYMLGDKMPNGCPSCKCLGKGTSGGSNGQGQNNGFQLQGQATNDKWGSSSWNSGSGNGMNYGNGNTGTGSGQTLGTGLGQTFGTGSGQTLGTGSGSNNMLTSK